MRLSARLAPWRATLRFLHELERGMDLEDVAVAARVAVTLTDAGLIESRPAGDDLEYRWVPSALYMDIIPTEELLDVAETAHPAVAPRDSLGVFLGYSLCCSRAFGTDRMAHSAAFGGFVPCTACVATPQATLIAGINARRNPRLYPFPVMRWRPS